jgi:LysR family transcriptional regulator, benzoate and cis,cis-muconate-responsive activator of ben and cat genes
MAFNRDHLRYFVTVADEGQITKAARRLFMAQPALSQAISQLESELGLRLLDRHARGVTLTDAGEAFLEKARAAVESESEVRRTAESLARAERGILEVGFIGPPPTMTATELITAFAQEHPEAELSFRDLPFPCGTTRSWLEPVDVALCQTPALDPDIRIHPVRSEPRTVVVPAGHRLAAEKELDIADVLDETFISYHADVQPAWSAFHSLDDHRGGPPKALTDDHVTTALQILGIFATTDAVTTLPMADALLVHHVLPGVRAIPLRDAQPAVLSLIWRAEDEHPLVSALVKLSGASALPEASSNGATPGPPTAAA